MPYHPLVLCIHIVRGTSESERVGDRVMPYLEPICASRDNIVEDYSKGTHTHTKRTHSHNQRTILYFRHVSIWKCYYKTHWFHSFLFFSAACICVCIFAVALFLRRKKNHHMLVISNCLYIAVAPHHTLTRFKIRSIFENSMYAMIAYHITANMYKSFTYAVRALYGRWDKACVCVALCVQHIYNSHTHILHIRWARAPAHTHTSRSPTANSQQCDERERLLACHILVSCKSNPNLCEICRSSRTDLRENGESFRRQLAGPHKRLV